MNYYERDTGSLKQDTFGDCLRPLGVSIRPVARLFFVGGQIGQIWGPFMITCGLSCDRVEFVHFFFFFGGGGGVCQMTPLTTPLATGLSMEHLYTIEHY